jgi:hypothetical protein
MIHPINREYENNVLPEDGDPQVVWPKNTATTAAAVAALAQCASSPQFKKAYPEAAAAYWASAQLGWRFLTNAIATHGKAGAYQKIMHFDDAFTHNDDLAWAACEMYLATGDPQYHSLLMTWFPDPTDPATTRWGWWKMFATYGNAIRSYAAAVKSGRLEGWQLNQDYLAKCLQAIADCGNDNLRWSQLNAYGTSFPDATKRVRTAGWYYSAEQAFDIVVAHEFAPNPAYVNAIIENLNFETGCNPVNVPYLTGMGWHRQREIVDQYSANDRRRLPKIGIPIGNIQEGFVSTWTYGHQLAPLCSPSDGADTAPYPFYDRWSDFWNVTTEVSTSGMARGYAVTLWLAAQTATATQPWSWTNATILAPSGTRPIGQPVTVTLQVADPNLAGARITWEAREQEPVFGGLNYTFTPTFYKGPYWIEAEVQWPDGRRAFAMTSVNIGDATNDEPPVLGDPQMAAGGGFSFNLTGVPFTTYIIQASANATAWQSVSTNTLPANGNMRITDPLGTAMTSRYFRAVRAQ